MISHTGIKTITESHVLSKRNSNQVPDEHSDFKPRKFYLDREERKTVNNEPIKEFTKRELPIFSSVSSN